MGEEVSSDKQALQKDLEGEVYKLQPSITCGKQEHFFKLVSASAAECTKCPVGYPLPLGSEICDGHIYINNKFVL